MSVNNVVDHVLVGDGNLPDEIMVFGLSVKLVWQNIVNKPDVHVQCTAVHFYLYVNEVAAYWVNPEQNEIIIECLAPEVSYTVVTTWLLGTVMAYLLQYHGYLVLHGSAVLIDEKAVIFSGDSGAGKSTTASALVKQGYSLLTDDVVVVKKLEDGSMVLVPGPAKLKLWADALVLLEHNPYGLQQVVNKADKYQLPVSNHDNSLYQIGSFYELNPDSVDSGVSCCEVFGVDKLQLLIKNTYRYKMLRPLNMLEQHFISCGLLAESIQVFKIKRPAKLDSLAEILSIIRK